MSLCAGTSIESVVGSSWDDLSGLTINVTREGALEQPMGARMRMADGVAAPPAACSFAAGARHCLLRVPLPPQSRHPWTPQSPFLFNFTLALVGEKNRTLDSVHSYAALRTVGRLRSAEPGGKELTRLTLNGRRAYLIGTLDQGFWPEGVYTAPTDEALASDLLTLKRLGFDAVRKHQKIEPRRFYYHCDRLGIAVIQDFPGGRGAFGNASVEARFRAELRQMVRRTAAHPSGKIF